MIFLVTSKQFLRQIPDLTIDVLNHLTDDSINEPYNELIFREILLEILFRQFSIDSLKNVTEIYVTLPEFPSEISQEKLPEISIKILQKNFSRSKIPP